MAVEVATFVSQLVDTNPASSDLRSQGDDHLRLIKDVLQNTFPTASKAFYNPTSEAKAASFIVAATDMNKTFMCDPAGGIIDMTLPTLAAGDAGWECFMIKTTTGTNPVLIKPAAGSVASGQYSVTAARRCIPRIRISCFWSGTTWYISRACSVPIGSTIEYHLGTLAVGYEFPSGQILASAATNYAEYNTAFGSGQTPDKRGRVGVTLDNLGGVSAGRLAGGIIVGTAVGNIGGTDTVTLSLAQTPTGITSNNAAQSITVTTIVGDVLRGSSTSKPATGGPDIVAAFGSAGLITSTAVNAISVTSNNTGGLAHSNLQPSIMVSELLIVE